MKKKLILFVLSGFTISSLFSQITIKQNTHALKCDTENSMTLCSYMDPGPSGNNITWDFSELTNVDAFIGKINIAESCRNIDAFLNANTELTEFGNKFYFNVTENEILDLGFSARNILIKYTEPLIKMKFPFTMNDYFSGDFYGNYTANSQKGIIDGTYEVEADAYGTLLLPLNIEVKNTLRIKNVKTYQEISENHVKNISTTTYRWYCMQNRYPLLVLIESKTETENSGNTKYKAAYNNVLKSSSFIKNLNNVFFVYPNPVSEMFSLNYLVDIPGRVVIEVFDMNSKKIYTIENSNHEPGYYSKEIAFNEISLINGIYYIKCQINNYFETQEIIYLK